jgi:GT2 family glycosyltransferase
VVVPTFERRASVERLLQALCRQTAPADQFEVVVSIDGSGDGTRELVSGFSAPYRLTGLYQANRGRSAARNAGLRVASGDLVAFLDDDMEPAPEFVEGHLEAHRAPGLRGVVGAAPIVRGDGSNPGVGFMSRAFDLRLERLAQADEVRFNDAYTGNFSTSRDVLVRLGGYDEGFTLYGHEDYELLHRLVETGVKLTYAPRALAYQHYEKTFPAVAEDAMARGRTAVYFARKHPEVAGQLRLGAYARETRKWRLLRRTLLAATRMSGGIPRGVTGLMTWLERRRPRRLDRYYTMALDYCYWAGVQAATREDAEAPS